MWAKLKRWWQGCTCLHIYLTGGQIIDVYVSDWNITHDDDGRVTKYSFVFHPRNRNIVQTLAIKDISAVVKC